MKLGKAMYLNQTFEKIILNNLSIQVFSSEYQILIIKSDPV